MAVALGVMITLGDAATTGRVILTVNVQGRGRVVVTPGGRSCSHRCRERLPAGATISLGGRPGAGNYLLRWSGPCAQDSNLRCAFRLPSSRVVTARFVPNTVLASWNPFYKCKPILTTIPFILGPRQNRLHGATETGGGFQPHLRGGEDQHLLRPPCAVGRRGTFVEIRDIAVAAAPDHSTDGDEVVNLVDPHRPRITDVYMKTIHTEIDNQLRIHGVAPPIQPKPRTAIDIQGFVFWDPAHTTANWHSFSGWEIHTVTAWRLARGRS
jgi:hypothetical protein